MSHPLDGASLRGDRATRPFDETEKIARHPASLSSDDTIQSLREVAQYLSIRTAFSWSRADVLQLALDGHLQASVVLRGETEAWACDIGSPATIQGVCDLPTSRTDDEVACFEALQTSLKVPGRCPGAIVRQGLRSYVLLSWTSSQLELPENSDFVVRPAAIEAYERTYLPHLRRTAASPSTDARTKAIAEWASADWIAAGLAFPSNFPEDLQPSIQALFLEADLASVTALKGDSAFLTALKTGVLYRLGRLVDRVNAPANQLESPALTCCLEALAEGNLRKAAFCAGQETGRPQRQNAETPFPYSFPFNLVKAVQDGFARVIRCRVCRGYALTNDKRQRVCGSDPCLKEVKRRRDEKRDWKVVANAKSERQHTDLQEQVYKFAVCCGVTPPGPEAPVDKWLRHAMDAVADPTKGTETDRRSLGLLVDRLTASEERQRERRRKERPAP
jgi:hypothetical protein